MPFYGIALFLVLLSNGSIVCNTVADQHGIHYAGCARVTISTNARLGEGCTANQDGNLVCKSLTITGQGPLSFDATSQPWKSTRLMRELTIRSGWVNCWHERKGVSLTCYDDKGQKYVLVKK